MYKTDGNLQNAFATECQAYCRYVLFANRAESDGFPEIAHLFRAAAEAEFVHLRNHFTVMGGLGATKDNILAGATAEHYEITRIYPVYIEDAQVDRNEGARITFDLAYKAEKVHNEYFEKALEKARNNQSLQDTAYFVCQVCGNIVTGKPPERCSICNNATEKFKEVK